MQSATKQPATVRPDILIQSGCYFSFIEPANSEFGIEDIAYGLSNACRFAGQCRPFYSVAQHSVMVSYLVPPEYAFDALMHDAAEAFTGDISKPLKQLLPDFKVIEKRVEAAVFARFGVTNPLPAPVKHADLVMLATEQRDLMPPHDDEWALISDITPLHMSIDPVDSVTAYNMFMRRYRELRGEVEDADQNVCATALPMPLTRWWVKTRPCRNAVQFELPSAVVVEAVEWYVPLWAWPLEWVHRLVFGRTSLEAL